MTTRARTTPPESPESRGRSTTFDELITRTSEPDFHQERSRRSYMSLIDSATELFAARGYDAVGTPEIASHAGVSVGTFYRYFDDKHAVYLEIARRRMITAWRETMQDMSPQRFLGLARHETIAATVEMLFKHVLARPELTRSIRQMSLRDPEVADLTRAFEKFVIDRIAMLIKANIPRDTVPDPEATAYVIYSCAMECAWGLTGLGQPIVDPERAKRALADFVERALFPSAAPKPTP
ncbi:MAG: TetR/AcrR family transcriptional regulator [Kofleriaceae bacterium]